MNKLLLFLILLFSNFLFGQNTYRINQSIWSFSKPIDYHSRIDNFEKERKAGQEYLEKEEGIKSANDDVILFSLQKNDSSSNVIFASFKGNSNIKKHTLNGYAKIIKDVLINQWKNEFPKEAVTVDIDEVLIDKIKFNVVRQTINFIKEDYILTKSFYIAEIEDKEIMIVVVNDNETDRIEAEESILKSTFK